MGENIEQLTRVRPLRCSFDLDVPSRLASMYSENGYESLSSAIFRSACVASDVVIDIGAHIGYYASLAASANPNARIIAIEASPENASVISSNVEFNHHKIEVWNAVFFDKPGSVNFKISEVSDNCGISGHPISPTLSELELEAITGDELAINPGQRLVIKIDVEGQELSALKGLDRVFREAADVRILIEFNPKCILSASQYPSELLEWILVNDFRIFALDELGHQWQEVSDSNFGENIGLGYINLWCIPADIAMTVCAVLHAAGLGGAERSHVEVVESLIGAGCMIHTIMPAPDIGLAELLHEAGSSTSLVSPYPWWIVPINQPVQPDAKSDWRNNLISKDILDVIQAIDPEVILTQSIAVPQGAIAALALDKPHVWWIREFGDKDYDFQLPLSPKQTGKLVASLSDKVLTNSAAVRDYFFKGDPEMAKVVHPIPRLDNSSYSNIPTRRAWTIGIVGNLHPGKGQTDGLNAIAKLVSEGYEIKLLCIGGGNEEVLKQLKELTEQLGIRDKVSFVGHLRDRSAIYNLVDAVAVTSRAEAFGRVPFEATDAGVPVVYAKSGGIIEYMVEGETGLAYTPGSADELALAIKSLATDAELGLRLVSGARSHFQDLRNDPTRVKALVNQLRGSRDSHSENIPRRIEYWILKSAIAERDSAIAERDSAIAERDSAIAERDSAIAERDSAIAERDSAIAERDSAIAERDSAIAERDSAIAERDSAIAERDSAIAELSLVKASTIWRLFSPYRKIISIITNSPKPL